MRNSTYHVFFSNLSSPLRIGIVSCLKEGEKSVGDLVGGLNVEQSKLSHALRSLRECNIVNVKVKGKKRIYSLNKKTIVPMLKLIDKHAQQNCKAGCETCNCKKENKKGEKK